MFLFFLSFISSSLKFVLFSIHFYPLPFISNEIWKSIYVHWFGFVSSASSSFISFPVKFSIHFHSCLFFIIIVVLLFSFFHLFLFKVCSIFYSFRTRFGKVFTYVHWFGFISSSSSSSFIPFPVKFVFYSFFHPRLFFIIIVVLLLLFSFFHPFLFKVCSIFYSFSPLSTFYL